MGVTYQYSPLSKRTLPSFTLFHPSKIKAKYPFMIVNPRPHGFCLGLWHWQMQSCYLPMGWQTIQEAVHKSHGCSLRSPYASVSPHSIYPRSFDLNHPCERAVEGPKHQRVAWRKDFKCLKSSSHSTIRPFSLSDGHEVSSSWYGRSTYFSVWHMGNHSINASSSYPCFCSRFSFYFWIILFFFKILLLLNW